MFVEYYKLKTYMLSNPTKAESILLDHVIYFKLKVFF